MAAALAACGRSGLYLADSVEESGSGGAPSTSAQTTAVTTSVTTTDVTSVTTSGDPGCTSDFECDDQNGCTSDACLGGVCQYAIVDGDGDGYVGFACGGDDCDDSDPSVHPGQSEICADVVDNDCNGLTGCADPSCVADPQCLCTVGPGVEACQAVSYQSRTYLFCDFDVDWATARSICVGAFGDLVTIGDGAENDFLWDTSLLVTGQNTSSWWIGLSDIAQEGFFTWADGSALGYSHWHPGEPNDLNGEDCVEGNSHNGSYEWNDRQCPDLIRFICELPCVDTLD